MAIVEVVVIPLGDGTSVSKYVAKCVDVVRKSGLDYQLTPMGTVIQGDIGAVLEVIKNMHEIPFGEGAKRVNTIIRIDDRRDKEISFQSKIKAVEEKLK